MKKFYTIYIGWFFIISSVLLTYIPINIIVSNLPINIFIWILSPFTLIFGIWLSLLNEKTK